MRWRWFTRAVVCFELCVISIYGILPSFAQNSVSVSAHESPVPRLVRFTGVAADANGKLLSGVVGATLSLYKNQDGGASLWIETQNATADASGHYTVQLGASRPDGLPVDLFTSGEARWLGVSINGEPERPRVLLLSVPYALKAADAETVGGLPPSAFVLASPPGASLPATGANGSITSAASVSNAPAAPSVTGSGTPKHLPLWTGTAAGSTTIGDSAVFQSGTGGTARIGVNTAVPASTLDVNGTGTVRGMLSLPSVAKATATTGANSQPLDSSASVFNSSTAAAQNETFQWQSEPKGNNTINPSATLNLLFGSGAGPAAETGLQIDNQGVLTFATGQTFPGIGTGTVTSVGSGAGLTGGPITQSGTLSIASGGVTNAMLANPSMSISPGTGLTGGGLIPLGGSTTLSLDTTKVPLLTTANNFAANQSFAGNIRVAGGISASSSGLIQIDAPFVPGGRFTVLTNGNVGINNPNPTTTLDVGGSINTNGIRVNGGISASSSAPVQIDAPFVPGGRFTVLTNGNVGINNPNPTATLDVGGSVRINGDVPMSNAPRMVFSGFLAGNLGGSPLGGFFIPDHLITITRITASERSPGSGCSNHAQAQVSIVGFAPLFSLDLGDNQSFADSGPISVGTQLNGTQLQIQAAPASGCTIIFGTSPSDVFVNVQYVMQ